MEQQFACLERRVEAEITADTDIPQQGDVPGLGALGFRFSLQPLELRAGWNCPCSGWLPQEGHLNHRVGVVQMCLLPPPQHREFGCIVAFVENSI